MNSFSRSFIALGTVLALVARGVDGRIECDAYLGRYFVKDAAKCWGDTIDTRFSKNEKLMSGCDSYGVVSC